jgi:hypothetical protein
LYSPSLVISMMKSRGWSRHGIQNEWERREVYATFSLENLQ